MMWFDNSRKRSFEQKLAGGVQYYKEKYGEAPNCCHVNPAMFDGNESIDGVEIRADKAILPNHFWIGVVEDNE